MTDWWFWVILWWQIWYLIFLAWLMYHVKKEHNTPADLSTLILMFFLAGFLPVFVLIAMLQSLKKHL